MNAAGWLCREIFPAAPFPVFLSPAVPTSLLALSTGRRKTRPGFALGSPGSSRCRSDRVLICGNATRKFLILVVSTLLSLQPGYSPGYRCSGPGLMFCSIQAMTMAGLCHPGQLSTTMPTAPMCSGAGMGAPGPPDLEFETISRDHPDGHAQVSPGAVAASQVPVLAWP